MNGEHDGVESGSPMPGNRDLGEQASGEQASGEQASGEQALSDVPPQDGAVSPSKPRVDDSERPTLGRFLYTHNPFYLISCFLVIYGLQGWAVRGEDLWLKSASMAGGLVAYTLLMMVTCIAVVRWGKVWEDARSIFLVVLIGVTALSISYDELCMFNPGLALAMAVACGLFSIMVCESVMRGCRLRLSRWYRTALYAMLAVFFISPVAFGAALHNRLDDYANSGAIVFSFAMGAAMLFLVPTVRKGQASAGINDAPWRWPWYPLSAFGLLVVLAGIRSHAIWMSFGFRGSPVVFEPILLMPMMASCILLLAEAGLGQQREKWVRVALLSTPLLLLMGLSRQGMTNLPMQSDLQYWVGSGWTLALLVVLAIYAYLTLRRVRFAEFGIPGVLLFSSATARMPGVLEPLGLEHWMLAAAAVLVSLSMVLRHRDSDWLWSLWAAMVTMAIAMAGRAYGLDREGYLASSLFAIGSMMVIGACFETSLGQCLRVVAAVGFVIAAGMASYRWERIGDVSSAVLVLLFCGAVASAYAFWIKRWGWFCVTGVQVMVFVMMVSWSGYRSGRFREVNWPISSGLACFGVGVAITTSKTAFYDRLKRWRQVERGRADGSGEAGESSFLFGL
ncbi:hypothetical protein N9N28_06420 [Rubripirellula amarantea]|nr:hypothetical protein [Rubripirellula amarantea]